MLNQTQVCAFLKKKKMAINNILDAAVKEFEFEQKDYIKLKASMMSVVEKIGNERVGLEMIVSLTNKLISKIAKHSGYVSAVPGEVVESENNKTGDVSEGAKGTSSKHTEPNEPVISPHTTISLSEKPKVAKKQESSKGKENLLKLVRFLPPFISNQEVELIIAKLRRAPIGAPTGSKPARTTGDIESELTKQVLGEYSFVYDDLVESNRPAFVEKIMMANGAEREADVSDKLRKKLTKIRTLAEFLSIKDMVDRLIKDFNAPTEIANSKSKLFFWRKK